MFLLFVLLSIPLTALLFLTISAEVPLKRWAYRRRHRSCNHE